MSIFAYDNERTEKLQVVAEVRTLNQYVQRAKKIAISAIDPIRVADGLGGEVRALNIQVEGPPTHISYFKRLLAEANLHLGF